MGAVISDCGRYRYTLEREWLTGSGTCLFVMLNPSTADASEDDPTIRRCVRFAQGWGYGRLTVGNLFAFRATDPNQLLHAADPIGPENDRWLARLCDQAQRIVIAWGAHPKAQARAEVAMRHVIDRHPYKRPFCLGATKSGAPRHPLYVPGDFEPIEFAATSPSKSKEGGEADG